MTSFQMYMSAWQIAFNAFMWWIKSAFVPFIKVSLSHFFLFLNFQCSVFYFIRFVCFGFFFKKQRRSFFSAFEKEETKKERKRKKISDENVRTWKSWKLGPLNDSRQRLSSPSSFLFATFHFPFWYSFCCYFLFLSSPLWFFFPVSSILFSASSSILFLL